MMHLFEYEGNAIRAILNDRLYALLMISLSIIITVIYLILLPSLPNGTISPKFIRFITPLQVIFSIIFGTLLALIIVLNLYFRRVRKVLKSGSAASNTTVTAVASTFVNLLCCTPILPSIIALFGASTPLIFNLSVPVEAFFENNYIYFYFMSAILFVVSIHYISKNVSCCVLKRGEKHDK